MNDTVSYIAAGWKPFLVAGLLAMVQSAAAQPAPNPVAPGKQLAQQYCVQCHVIVPSTKPGWTDAPAFDAIANRPGVTAAKLSEVAQKPHMHMMNDERPKNEADAIAAYIISLRHR
jgi:mono/diheme cytochrome c family protein